MAQISGSLTLETSHLEYLMARDVVQALSPILGRIEEAVTGTASTTTNPPQQLGSRDAARVIASHLPAGVGSVGCPTPEDVAGYLARYLADSGYVICKTPVVP